LKSDSDPLLEGGSLLAGDEVAVAQPLPNKSNYSYLDGLRGIGALVVYFNHFISHFFPLPPKEKLADDEYKDK
jgi:hypothetical protein